MACVHFLMDIYDSVAVLDVIQTGLCTSNNKDGEIQFQWLLLQLDCMEELYRVHTQVNSSSVCMLIRSDWNAAT